MTEHRYDPFSGADVVPGEQGSVSASAALGLEPPRFCTDCGRKMIVQIVPDGWTARCSRHGVLDSASDGRR